MFNIDDLIQTCEYCMIDEKDIATESMGIIVGSFYVLIGTFLTGALLHESYKNNRKPRDIVDYSVGINTIKKARFVRYKKDRFEDFKIIVKKLQPNIVKLTTIINDHKKLNPEDKNDVIKINKMIDSINQMINDLDSIFKPYKNKKYTSEFEDGVDIKNELIKLYNDLSDFSKIDPDDIIHDSNIDPNMKLASAINTYIRRVYIEISPFAQSIKFQSRGLNYNNEKK